MMAFGVNENDSRTREVIRSSGTVSVPNASIITDTGSATPIAYANCTSALRANPAATTFFAMYRSMLTGDRSPFGGTSPRHPPPALHGAPAVRRDNDLASS